MSEASYFISTPYIDAYEHDFEPTHPRLDYAAFCSRMNAQSLMWGEQGLGRALRMGKEPPMYDGRYVLAFGSHDSKKYVALSPSNGEDLGIANIVEIDSIPEGWDVT